MTAWVDLVAQMRVATVAAEAAGIQLAFEPEYNNVVDSARQARRLIDEVGSPALKVLMDAANLFHRGDLERMSDHLREAFQLVGPDIVLAHAKDLDHDGDAGGRAAGQGRLDYSLYLAELQGCGFDGAIVLHQLKELAPERIGTRGRVRARARAGRLSELTVEAVYKNGRTSTFAWQAFDPSAASSRATSRSGASMIQRPMTNSFVSTNGPSVMIVSVLRWSTTVAASGEARPPANTQ